MRLIQTFFQNNAILHLHIHINSSCILKLHDYKVYTVKYLILQLYYHWYQDSNIYKKIRKQK